MPFATPGQSIVTRGKRRVVIGGATSALAADILLDFVNNVYRVNGTTYATAALAGFTGTGTFDASGYTATGTQKLTGTVDLPGDFIVFSDFATGDVNSARNLWRHAGTNIIAVTSASGLIVTNISSASSATATKFAIGLSGGVSKASVDGTAVVTGGSYGAQGSAAFEIGNNAASNRPWAVPIRKIAIYKQTLTDAQIQALT